MSAGIYGASCQPVVSSCIGGLCAASTSRKRKGSRSTAAALLSARDSWQSSFYCRKRTRRKTTRSNKVRRKKNIVSSSLAYRAALLFHDIRSLLPPSKFISRGHIREKWRGPRNRGSTSSSKEPRFTYNTCRDTFVLRRRPARWPPSSCKI
ncbi:unnamed protein product [Trichogramma brassicae]|uniref:Uncharacterized protein n=1 Tax=Trichogramma brassicae TaxID=86971 RepID=A0A6H5IC31_9HYME|nr:unnamed protein product [Trichogramma brassicae]